ncbi:MAG: hypothetical protein M0Q41_12590 [Bacteroidales bacterium]|nr:hypothetical protein [Bacteroidales bacterium]
MYSYHIFLFPFNWSFEKNSNKLFEQQVSLNNIVPDRLSNWIRQTVPSTERELKELYDEKNYYYDFIHQVLYDSGEDSTIVKHYERKELKHEGSQLSFNIEVRDKKNYQLKIDDIALNFYSTGVGTLIFYLRNENEDQKDFSDIKLINQFGRRIMPPFIEDVDKRFETAERVYIDGLWGGSPYDEDFNDYSRHLESWKPASYILQLINDFSEDIQIKPVIDDRMIVNCWYANDHLSTRIQTDYEKFLQSDDWYSFVFIDSTDPTCQNDKFCKRIIKKATNPRWQNYGTLYGITRYSMVALGAKDFMFETVIFKHVRTLYTRMLELVLLQRSSRLRFSAEVTKVGIMKKAEHHRIADHISSLYKEYMLFMNQIYFREVTSQDQGIEFYQLFLEQFGCTKQISDLEEELGELHNYYHLLLGQKRNKNAEILNIIAATLLPASLLAAIFSLSKPQIHEGLQVLSIGLVIVFFYFNTKRILKK